MTRRVWLALAVAFAAIAAAAVAWVVVIDLLRETI
jgi:hypothetical protein